MARKLDGGRADGSAPSDDEEALSGSDGAAIAQEEERRGPAEA